MNRDLFEQKPEPVEIILRDYQEEAIEQVRTEFRKGHKKVVIKYPTGAGKTFLSMYMVKGAISKGLRVAFVVDQINLIEQTVDAARAVGVEFGVIQGNHPLYNIDASLQICSIQTLKNRFKDFDMVVVDECHQQYAAQIEWMERHSNVYFIGLSATPFAKGMGLVWDTMVEGPTTRELIDRGYLCDFEAFGPTIPDLSGVKSCGGDYNTGDLSELMRGKSIVADILKSWVNLGENRQTIAFCVDIAHANEVADQFSRAGYRAESLHSKLPDQEKERILAAFKAQEIKILCSVAMVIKGFDSPIASCAIIARPTKSLMLHIQMLGRVLRTHQDKDKALLLDHANNLQTLGLPDTPLPSKLDTSKKGERQEALQDQDEPMPKVCPAPDCGYIKPPKIHKCPACGFAPQKFSGVEILPGELKKMTPTQKNKVKGNEMKDLAGWYGFFQGFQQKNGYKGDWADQKFKKEFGFNPREKFAGESIPAGGEWTPEQRQWIVNYNRRSRFASRVHGGKRMFG